MKLHWSPRSPFVRKVMIVLEEKKLRDQVDCQRTLVMMHAPPPPELLKDNPLGKIPALVLADGTVLFDSRVICEFLDGLGAGPQLLPEGQAARIQCLRWQALGDGLTDILLMWRIMLSSASAADPAITAGFDTKVHATMDCLEQEVGRLNAQSFGLGHIAIICALGQLDFRYAECGWRDAFPRLATWLHSHETRTSVNTTAVVDDGTMPMGDLVMPLRFSAPAKVQSQ